MDTVPGVKAFFSVLTFIVIALEAHDRLHTVMLLMPRRGACRKTTEAAEQVCNRHKWT